MKINKFLTDLKVRSTLQDVFFSSLYEENKQYPTKEFDEVWENITKSYDSKNKWIKKERDEKLIFVCNLFWEYSQKKAENSNGIEATKTYNLYQTLLYLNHLFVEENIDNQEIPNQIKEVELRFLRLLYAGLIEIKYVFGSEYPYSKVPNNFWNYRLKYLKDLPFNFLEEQENLDFKELNYYGYSKLNDNYSSVDLVGLDRQDLWNFEYMIKVVEVKKKLIQNLSLLQARNLHVCSVEMKKLGLQINFDAIINDSQKDL